MNTWRRVRIGGIVLACGLAAAACGVKSAPQHREGSDFPRAYPTAGPEQPVYKTPRRPARQTQPVRPPASGIYQYPNPPTYRPPEQ